MNEIKGLDLSDYQRGLSIASLRSQGVKFLILKLGYGTTVVDSCFPYFYSEAVKNGLAVGAYFFSLATTEESAIRDAKRALALAGGRKLPLGIFMDVETSEQMRLRDSELTAVCKAFCDTIRAGGYRPGAYGSGLNLWGKVGPSYLGDDVLVWEAAWDRSAPFHACDVWQTSEKGRINGYNGNVDTDLCMSERFYALITGKEDPQPTPEPAPNPTPEPQPEPPTESTFSLDGIPVLKIGDTGAPVKAMQGELLANGYSCGGKKKWCCGTETADGIFGNVTRDSVALFQASHGLPGTGVVDQKTRAALLGVTS